MDTEIKSLEYLLREINHKMNLVTKNYLNSKNITMSRFWVLNKLHSDEAITMKQLQSQLLLSPSTLTGLIDNLVADDLVSRWRDTKDRRLVFLKLTVKGSNLLNEILEYRTLVLKKIVSKCTKDIDLNMLNKNLETLLKMSNNIDAIL
ncbi:MarR family winged helix-turn-helix transcriptional regulator [Thermoanaerobacterium thermosaccharolyticum]|uniref:MarR family transcriptional regulator n=1 Tax=Thermoanaerobacterium thermosaccharolyticum TaxID=1517 RepID=A0A223HV62_THETR|nr:MarR family transcriptional regulator [Thermoanaerobacterium thermosaccharolyticum]AST56339.1 MarR family transcriptional regulator [Thermoanaerobacterium thermosaccharolyticum]MBE0069550.1 MarR family transcriptional regulator [Thermoanaerobacterium thermosaccharolyticum]MBE0229231.1 MarR family transcriptional regulator [Thermoanaerobacterium thermosaccharolyticum]MCP2240564.1 DNA-binding MarR family transcriptional regulator [Thermoanaerobacterium thermosaccharolyticum]